MALIDFKFLPGIDKQDTTSGAEFRWVDSDNVRFRYGLPEKVGGWSSLITDTIVGVARREFAFVDLAGNRYVAIGTDKFLLIYFEGQLYDITPLKTTLSSATIATTDASAVCNITTGSNHNLTSGDIVLLDNVTLPGGTGYTDADFQSTLLAAQFKDFHLERPAHSWVLLRGLLLIVHWLRWSLITFSVMMGASVSEQSVPRRS